jgi:hypothetical protein
VFVLLTALASHDGQKLQENGYEDHDFGGHLIVLVAIVVSPLIPLWGQTTSVFD